MQERGRKNKGARLVVWTAVSLLVHGFIFVGVRAPKPPPPPPPAQRHAVTIAIVNDAPKSAAKTANNAEVAAPRAPARRRTYAPAAHPSAPSVSPSVARAPAEPASRYADYLPGAGYSVSDTRGSDAVASDDSGTAAFAALTRNVAPLSHFAREVAEHVALPEALTKIAPSGTARVRFTRLTPTRWTVSRADGDPYFRAALFESLNALTPVSLAIAYLEQARVASISVATSYRTVSSVDQRTPPLTILVEGNVIHLDFVRKTDSAAWGMIMPVDQRLAVDLVGVASYLMGKATHRDEADADLKRLRLSPAFTRPFTLRP